MTKSVTGLLVGIALHDGYLTSLRQPVLSFFPERPIANRNADKEAITIEDLLTMQPGLDCADSKVGYTVQDSQDWVQSVLDLPMANPPGKTFVYCTRAPHLLSAILTIATGMSMEAYAQTRVFDPLGIRSADRPWASDPQGITTGGYGLALDSPRRRTRPRDRPAAPRRPPPARGSTRPRCRWRARTRE